MYFLQSLLGHASGFHDLINNVKVVTYKFLRRFCSNILLKILVLFLIVIIVISFGRLALFRHTFNRCELLCNFIIT